MTRPVWFVELIKMAFPSRFVAARATRLPGIGGLVDRWLFDGDHLIYLPKEQVIQVDEPVEQSGEMVLPSQVVEHFIEQAGTHWVMNNCICRDGSQCKDFPVDLGCLFLGEAASGINPRLGRQVTKAEALDHVRRCRGAGLVHLVGRNKLDTVWLGVGPGEKLLTICNCCPCCCLWGMLPHLSPEVGARVASMPGVVVQVTDRCVGCGTCTQAVCFVAAIEVVDGRAVIGQGCKGCGRCVEVCPEDAIELSFEGAWSVEATVGCIAPLVDVS
jgi:ferredoxin